MAKRRKTGPKQTLPSTKALVDLEDHWPTPNWSAVGVIVAVSGGMDSVALLRAMVELKSKTMISPTPPSPPNGFLVIAHFNHKLRGAAADGDQAFVEQLARQLNLNCHVQCGAGGTSDEAGLAHQRMAFLIRTAHQTGCRYIATAHHRDDNVETLLHQLFRGSGAAGLTAMPMFRSLPDDLVLARPWINTPRQYISNYLQSIRQTHRHDGSNDDCQYTRNWIRHEVLPLIRNRFPNCDHAITAAGDSVRQWRTAIDQLAADWLDRSLANIDSGEYSESDSVRIRTDPLTPPAIVIAGLQRLWADRGWPAGDMTRSHWQSVYDMIAARARGAHPLPGDLIAIAQDENTEARHIEGLHTEGRHIEGRHIEVRRSSPRRSAS